MICAKAHPFRGTRFVFLKHVVAVRGEVVHLDERNLDSSVVSSIAQCYLDVGPAGKRGGSTAGSAKTGFFLAMRQRKRALTIRRARYGGDQASACLFFTTLTASSFLFFLPLLLLYEYTSGIWNSSFYLVFTFFRSKLSTSCIYIISLCSSYSYVYSIFFQYFFKCKNIIFTSSYIITFWNIVYRN